MDCETGVPLTMNWTTCPHVAMQAWLTRVEFQACAARRHRARYDHDAIKRISFAYRTVIRRIREPSVNIASPPANGPRTNPNRRRERLFANPLVDSRTGQPRLPLNLRAPYDLECCPDLINHLSHHLVRITDNTFQPRSFTSLAARVRESSETPHRPK